MHPQIRRKDREISQEEALAILVAGEYGFLATATPDGQPYCVPLSYVVWDNAVWFHGALDGHKVRNLAANSRACFSVVGSTQPIYRGDYTTLYESAVVHGNATLVTDLDTKVEALRLLCVKYLPDHMEHFDGAMKAADRTGLWKLPIESITGKANRA